MKHDCTYCGMPADTVDHIIPIAYNYTKRRRHSAGNSGERVPCCRECNNLLGAKALFSIRERAQEVAECLDRRYSKELNAPAWSEDELIDLGATLRRQITARQFKRLEVIERIRSASSVAAGLVESAHPLWAPDRLKTA